MSHRKVQVKKSGQQSIKSFFSYRSATSSKRNMVDRNKKPVATIRPVSISHHDNANPSIDLTKSPIISRSNFTFKR